MKFKVGDKIRITYPYVPWQGRTGVILEVNNQMNEALTSIKNDLPFGNNCNTYWSFKYLEILCTKELI